MKPKLANKPQEAFVGYSRVLVVIRDIRVKNFSVRAAPSSERNLDRRLLLDLLKVELLANTLRVRIAGGECLRELLRLFLLQRRRNRGYVGVDPRLDHDRTVRAQRLVPRGAD